MRCISDRYGIHVIHTIKKAFPSLAITFTLLSSDVAKTMQFINKKKMRSLNIKATRVQHHHASAILGQRRQYWAKPMPSESDASMQNLSHLNDAQSGASFHLQSASQISPTQSPIDESANNQTRLNITRVSGIDKQQEKTDSSTKVAEWIAALKAPHQR